LGEGGRPARHHKKKTPCQTQQRKELGPLVGGGAQKVVVEIFLRKKPKTQREKQKKRPRMEKWVPRKANLFVLVKKMVGALLAMEEGQGCFLVMATKEGKGTEGKMELGCGGKE